MPEQTEEKKKARLRRQLFQPLALALLADSAGSVAAASESRAVLFGPVHALDISMLRPFDEVERTAHAVIGAAIEVHKVMGPGLLEGVYQECLQAELRRRGFSVETEVHVPLYYKGEPLETPLRIDLLVARSVVVEVKAVESLHPVHEAQVITYLTLTGLPAGLLMNFNEVLLKNGLRRLDHPDRYQKNT